MTRGDSESIVISCPERPFQEGDEVVFTVKVNEFTPEITLQKRVTQFDDGKAVIEIFPQDTNGMNYGRYKYDIQLTTAEGAVITIIKPATFCIEKEVTWDV